MNYNEPAYLKAKSEMQATMGSDISIPFLFAEKQNQTFLNFSFQTEKKKRQKMMKEGTFGFSNRDGGEAKSISQYIAH